MSAVIICPLIAIYHAARTTHHIYALYYLVMQNIMEKGKERGK